MRRRTAAGFSLLEVMVSVAILGISLVIVLEIATNNVRATYHARAITTASFLARTKLAAMEDDLLEVGFSQGDQEDQGDFGDEGFANYRWETLIEAVSLPTDIAQKTQESATEATQSDNPMNMMAGMLGGFMSTLIEPIRMGLEEAVRRVTVRVLWEETGRPTQSLEVVAFFTDPSKLDMAMGGLPGGLPGGQGGAGGTQTGRGGSSGTGTGTRRTTPPGTP